MILRVKSACICVRDLMLVYLAVDINIHVLLRMRSSAPTPDTGIYNTPTRETPASSGEDERKRAHATAAWCADVRISTPAYSLSSLGRQRRGRRHKQSATAVHKLVNMDSAGTSFLRKIRLLPNHGRLLIR